MVGDGSLNCGISLEGLNNAHAGGKNLIIILNDNKMSISRNVGGLARSLNHIISGSFYNRFKTAAKRLLFSLPRHKTLHKMIRRFEETVKYLILPGGLFEELGIRYIGPIDGHSIPDLLYHLRHLESQQAGPVLLHVTTEKGRGYEHARQNPARYHGVPGFCKATGRNRLVRQTVLLERVRRSGGRAGRSPPRDPRDHGGHERRHGGSLRSRKRTGTVFMTSASPKSMPVTYAAGLAIGGLRPICAIYATFMQRALDCVYHDVVLPQLPVIFTLDRAGAVEDGPTHHGIYDLGFLRALPA